MGEPDGTSSGFFSFCIFSFYPGTIEAWRLLNSKQDAETRLFGPYCLEYNYQVFHKGFYNYAWN